MLSDQDGLLAEMLASIETPEVAFIEYCQRKRQFPSDAIICFFEGKTDFAYYGVRVTSITDNKMESFVCGNKIGVLRTKVLIENNSLNSNLMHLYFTDKDFDNCSSEENIYVTPCYSIENFYITDTAFSNILVGELNLKPSNPDYNKALHNYRTTKAKFCKNVELLNAWYCIQKKHADSIHDPSIRPNLKLIKELTPFNPQISFDSIIIEYDIDTLTALTKNAISVSPEELAKEIEFLSTDCDSNYRGKYFVEFLRKYLTTFFNSSNSITGFFGKRIPVKITINSEKTVISSLSQYAETPLCLKQFLRNAVSI